jgi:hypothetical protein
MKRLFKAIVAAILVSLIGAVGVGAGDRHHTAEISDDARFEFLKQLEGVWVGKGLDGSDEGVYEFRVTAAGSAVREIEMIGTPMEMVTLYYMEGKQLVATHFCAMGNRPQAAATKRIVDETLTFACSGTPGGAKRHDEEHIHGWAMQLAADGSLHYSAGMSKNGEVSDAPSLVLKRQDRAAVRAAR